MLRTGRLHKPCKKCGELFLPTGRTNYICDNCIKNGNDNRWLEEAMKKQKEIKSRRKCKFLKDGKYCTHKRNEDVRSRYRRSNYEKRCLEKYCPLDFITKLKGGKS